MHSKCIVIILQMCLLYSCNKTEIQQLDLKGTIKGTIYAYDENGKKTDPSGCSVTIEGSDPLLSTTADENGKYELTDVPTGTYILSYTKEGFGEYKSNGFMFVGGGKPLYFNANIYKKPSTKINELKLSIHNNKLMAEVVLEYDHITNFDYYNRVIFFAHSENNISNSLYTYYLINMQTYYITELHVDLTMLLIFFPSGSKIHIVAYVYNDGYYLDQNSNRKIFTSVSQPTNVASIVIP